MRRLVSSFLFPRDSGCWLNVLRLGLGLELLSFTWLLRRDWNAFFGGPHYGLLGREVAEAMTTVQSPFIPRLGWIVFGFKKSGLTEDIGVAAVWWALVILAGLLILGLFPRSTAFLAWFLQLACAKSAGLFSYGADNMISIGLFYLAIAPVAPSWSRVKRCQSLDDGKARLVGFHRRAIQIHLCLIYFFSGLAKCLGRGWWDGSNMWRTLTIPPFDIVPANLIAAAGFLLPSLGIAVCLLETTYPFFIWPLVTRKPVLFAICAMHLAVGVLMGMYLFAGIMLVLNVAAYYPADWLPERRTASSGSKVVANSA